MFESALDFSIIAELICQDKVCLVKEGGGAGKRGAGGEVGGGRAGVGGGGGELRGGAALGSCTKVMTNTGRTDRTVILSGQCGRWVEVEGGGGGGGAARGKTQHHTQTEESCQSLQQDKQPPHPVRQNRSTAIFRQ